ncbi:hypothetical protein LEP1GSC125_3296 [Leptospira mayottensis 200901122]|uniref:Uncharacterized protein n=1 Tax=Leptospira mayottensis 200901122 TaxID=1193010 RepID=A0AA87MPX1_9LEPT|nr:hypothetical protein LEP1GSC125_3296 [Leptospira mayottensis 200901122]
MKWKIVLFNQIGKYSQLESLRIISLRGILAFFIFGGCVESSLE